eukprot:6187218-Pleurochrysis_carterae.AAC.1
MAAADQRAPPPRATAEVRSSPRSRASSQTPNGPRESERQNTPAQVCVVESSRPNDQLEPRATLERGFGINSVNYLAGVEAGFGRGTGVGVSESVCCCSRALRRRCFIASRSFQVAVVSSTTPSTFGRRHGNSRTARRLDKYRDRNCRT